MIRSTTHPPDSVSLELVLFKAGPHFFGLEASRVRGSGPLPDYEVLSVESLLHLASDGMTSRRQCVTLKGAVQEYELSIEAPLELCRLSADRIHALPCAVTARCKLPGLRGLALTEAGLILLVDLLPLLGGA